MARRAARWFGGAVRRRGLDLCVALVVGAAGGTVLHVAAHGRTPVATVPVEVAAAVLDRSDAVRGPADAVWRLEARGCGLQRQGSLTVVRLPGRGAVGLTNAHVVAGAEELRASTPDGVAGAVELVGAVPGRDLAVVSFPARTRLSEAAERAAAFPGPPAAAGDAVLAVGHPGGRAWSAAARVRAVELRVVGGVTSPVLVLDVPARAGSSGGGVFDQLGRVVGVVAARDPRSGAAVAHPLDQLGVATEPGRPGC